jgi:hypothetical protein
MSELAIAVPSMPPLAAEAPSVPMSRAEVEKAIVSLSDGEKTQLVKIARVFVRMRNLPYDHSDLLNEAFTRVIEERRQWPRTEPAVRFLAGVIRSIAWEWRNSVEVITEVDAGDGGAEEQATMDKMDAVRIIASFQNDPVAQKILVAKCQGARGEELQQLSGLNAVEYESKMKKIRRHLEKYET